MIPRSLPSRIRKTIKWGGAAVTVLLVVVWIGSGWYHCTWDTLGPGSHLRARWLFDGQVHLLSTDTRDVPRPSSTWRLERSRRPFRIDWGFFLPARTPRDIATNFHFVVLPIWPLCALSLIVTVVAWVGDVLARQDQRVLRCPRCGYDRSGLPLLAECPECGSGNPKGLLKPLRAALNAQGTNALLIFVVVGALILLWAIVKAYL